MYRGAGLLQVVFPPPPPVGMKRGSLRSTSLISFAFIYNYIYDPALLAPPPPHQRVWVHRILYVQGGWSVTSGLPPAPPCGLGGRVCMYMHVWVYVSMYVSMYSMAHSPAVGGGACLYVHVCMGVCMYLYVSMYVCIYVLLLSILYPSLAPSNPLSWMDPTHSGGGGGHAAGGRDHIYFL